MGMDTGSAVNSVRPRKQLSDKIWNERGLRPEVAKALLTVAKKFMDELELPLDVEDIILTGSYAGRTWGPGSDLDLHIVVDFDGLGDPEAAKRACKLAKFKWGEEHDVRIHGIPVEVYVESLDEDPPEATGRWSLLSKEWLLEPPRSGPSFDESKVVSKVMDFRKLLQRAERSRKEGPILAALKRITDLRKAGLQRGGELSTENLAFRVLRRTGELDAAWKMLHDAVDRDLSI
jgi:predicted nucleotidyltransferase